MRKVSIRLIPLWGFLTLLVGSVVLAQAAQKQNPSAPDQREMTADEREINAVLQEIFWRVKANDNSAFYENEFSYLRKEMTLDEYLGGIRFQRISKPNSDSIVALTLDSAVVTADTARAFLTLTIDDGSDTPPRHRPAQQRLYRENGHWIKPLSTNPLENDAFYRRIRQYEEDAKLESGG